jgi:hypothetical protein
MDIGARLRTVLADRRDIRLAYLLDLSPRAQSVRGATWTCAILFDELPAPTMLDTPSEKLDAAAQRQVDLVILNSVPLLAREVIARGQIISLSRRRARVVRNADRSLPEYGPCPPRAVRRPSRAGRAQRAGSR